MKSLLVRLLGTLPLGGFVRNSLLLGTLLLGGNLLGGDVYFSLRDFIVTTQPLVRRTVEIQPNSTPLASGTNIVLSERRFYNSGTNAEFTATNMVTGDYRVLLYGPTQTNVFWISVPEFSGTTNAAYLLIASGANAQRVVTTIKTNGTAITTSARSVDFIAGTNVVLRGTNASGFVTLEINSAGSAGGAATNAVSSILTNGATVLSGATSLRFVSGSNTLVLATNAGSGIASVQINAIGSSAGSTNLYTNVVYVNAVGTRYESATALTNAIQSATAGSLIVVGPGTYELRTNETSLTMKNGVDQFWMPGSKFIVGISNTVQNMFDDSFGALTSSIYGYGEFYLTNASGGGSILYADQNGSQVYFENQTAKTWSPGGDVINAGGPVKLRVLTRKDAASYQYDAFITAGNAISARWDILGDVYAGGDVAELGLSTNRGDVVFSFKNGYGNLGNGSGGLLKLGGNSEVTFEHLYDTGGAGTGSSVTRTGGGTNYAYVIGGVIHPWASHSGSFIRAHSPGDDTQIHFKGVTILGPASNDPILATNLHPLILENSAIVLGSGSTNWVRGQVPSKVQIRGGLGLNTYKPYSANITLSGIQYGSDYRAPLATIDDLTVTGSANITGDVTAGTLATTGTAGVGTFLNLGTVADQLLMADHEGYVTNVTIGSGLSLTGTTLSATGGAGSSNYTTIASGSLTVGSITSTNNVTHPGNVTMSGTGVVSGVLRFPTIATNTLLFLGGQSNTIGLGLGSGLSVSAGNLVSSGSGASLAQVTNVAQSKANTEYWYNVKDFGAAGDGSTDDTVAVSNTLYAAVGGAKTNEAVNAVVFFPRGRYVFGLQPHGPTVANAQIAVPVHPSYATWSTLRVIGEGPHPMADGSTITGNSATNGSIIIGTITNGNLFASEGPTNGGNYVTISIQDLTFQTPTNHSGTTLNLRDFVQGGVERVTVRKPVTHGSMSTRPIFGSTGIEMTKKDYASEVWIDRIDIQGFGIGVKLTEHLRAGTINIGGCSNGVYTTSGNYPNQIGYLLTYGCDTSIQSDGNACLLNIGLFANERLNTTGWRSNRYDIAGANAIKGTIAWYGKDDIDSTQSRKIRTDSVAGLAIYPVEDSGLTMWSGTGSIMTRGPRNFRTSADAIGPALTMGKSRGTTDTPSASQSSDTIGLLAFAAHDGTTFTNVGYIGAIQTGSAAANAVPIRLDFAPGTNANAVARMSITHDGLVGIGSTAPAVTLDVTGAVAAATIRLTNFVQLNATNGNQVYLKAANSNAVNLTNIFGLVEKASASVVELNANDAASFSITNRVTAATSVILTNTAVGQEISFTILGEASGGTSRTITIVPHLGHLVADLDTFGTALGTSKAFTLTNGNAAEVNGLIRRLNGTNVISIVTRQFAF